MGGAGAAAGVVARGAGLGDRRGVRGDQPRRLARRAAGDAAVVVGAGAAGRALRGVALGAGAGRPRPGRGEPQRARRVVDQPPSRGPGARLGAGASDGARGLRGAWALGVGGAGPGAGVAARGGARAPERRPEGQRGARGADAGPVRGADGGAWALARGRGVDPGDPARARVAGAAASAGAAVVLAGAGVRRAARRGGLGGCAELGVCVAAVQRGLEGRARLGAGAGAALVGAWGLAGRVVGGALDGLGGPEPDGGARAQERRDASDARRASELGAGARAGGVARPVPLGAASGTAEAGRDGAVRVGPLALGGLGGASRVEAGAASGPGRPSRLGHAGEAVPLGGFDGRGRDRRAPRRPRGLPRASELVAARVRGVGGRVGAGGPGSLGGGQPQRGHLADEPARLGALPLPAARGGQALPLPARSLPARRRGGARLDRPRAKAPQALGMASWSDPVYPIQGLGRSASGVSPLIRSYP